MNFCYIYLVIITLKYIHNEARKEELYENENLSI